MSIIKSNGAGESGGFYNGVATQSLRFDDGSSPSLSKTPDASNRKTHTLSMWIKRCELGANNSLFRANGSGDTGHIDIWFDANDKLEVAGASTYFRITSRVFRDTSAWDHIVFAFDTTDSTANDRLKIYVNGVQETSFATNNAIGEDADTGINANIAHSIGTGYAHFDGYMAEINFIDGTQLTPASFGEFKNGIWIAKNTGGLTFGTNGYRLRFDQTGVGTASTSTIGADTSGNNNHYTSTNIVASDCAMPDSPENNFSTWNALFKGGEQSSSIAGTACTLLNGNLEVSVPTNSYMGNTFRPTSGKWYCEFRLKTLGDARGEIDWGWLQATTYSDTTAHAAYANKWGAYYHAYSTAHIKVYDETSQLGSNINLTISAGDVLQLAWDIDNNKGWVGINDTYYAADNGDDGNPSSGTNQTFTFTDDEAQNLQCYVANGLNTDVLVANFGQDSTFGGDETATTNADANGIGAFHHAPPTGFLALCSANLPDLTIGPDSTTQADDYFNTVLWTGNGGTQSITGVGFKPDWIWFKNRSNALNGAMTDSSRGLTKELANAGTGTEQTTNDGITAFGTDGFSLGAGTEQYSSNTNNHTYVAWNWKANGATTTTNDASATSVGTIDSVYQVNTTAGFSIVQYEATGSAGTIAHGLSQAPTFMIVKSRDQNGTGWMVYFGDNTDYVVLEGEGARIDGASTWNDTSPTSTVFSVGDNGGDTNNSNGGSMIGYIFHDVEGYSKIGSYHGNGATDGTFVFTGFNPAWLMVKRIDTADNWAIYDSVRDTINVRDSYLYADTAAAEATYSTAIVDFLSNGFKWRGAVNFGNNSSGTYIYLAFAEAPFKFANAI